MLARCDVFKGNKSGSGACEMDESLQLLCSLIRSTHKEQPMQDAL